MKQKEDIKLTLVEKSDRNSNDGDSVSTQGYTISAKKRRRFLNEGTTLVSDKHVFDYMTGKDTNNEEMDKLTHRRQLVTFGGVFAPVALAMLSTNIFLRTEMPVQVELPITTDAVGNTGMFVNNSDMSSDCISPEPDEQTSLLDTNTRSSINSPHVYVRMSSYGASMANTAINISRRSLTSLTGVFVPVALSMFSTLLFLRMGFIVGQAGLLEAFSMYFLAYLILTMTVLSICAISTNGAVEGGGAYYMISRALGPEFGGSIGFIFFVANVFSCALYISGFVEGVMDNFGPGGNFISEGATSLPGGDRWWDYLYASIVCFVCLLICVFGGTMFARTLVFIFVVSPLYPVIVICTAMVFISIFVKNYNIDVKLPAESQTGHNHGNSTTPPNASYAYYTGLSIETLRGNMWRDYSRDYKTGLVMTYTSVFAILFSSVTGIMNGANMSGELKDPGTSIPRGTLSSSLFTFLVYIALSLFIAASCERKLLLNDYMFLLEINLWHPFVVIGIFAATLSAALGNLIGASRILEALGNDKLFWFFLKPATLTTRKGNPYMAVILSFVLVQLVLLIGSLNAIAPLVSVFFLLSYASTNLACLALELASAPNFRPTFKYYSWHTCTLGMIGCIVMCFLISPLYASIGVSVMLLFIILLHFQSLPSWGSISQALIFHQVRKYLLMLDSRKDHVKYWRPQVLMLVANPRHCCTMMDFVNDIKKGGLYIIGHVKLGRAEDFREDPLIQEYPKWLCLIDHLQIKAFAEVTIAESVVDGLRHLIRLSGLGGMKPNTICFGFYDDSVPKDTLLQTRRRRRMFFGSIGGGVGSELDNFFPDIRHGSRNRIRSSEFVQMIEDSLKLQKNVLVCRHFDNPKNPDFKSAISRSSKMYIDVWPLNPFEPDTANQFDTTCMFMLQLACILHMVPWWHARTRLRVYLCSNAETDDTLHKERKLDAFLHQLRIPASVQVIPWGSVLSCLLTSDAEDDEDAKADFYDCPPGFTEGMNELIRVNSVDTAVTFLYLPRPPSTASLHNQYLNAITRLTDDLPPTVLVHGLHPVISTTL